MLVFCLKRIAKNRYMYLSNPTSISNKKALQLTSQTFIFDLLLYVLFALFSAYSAESIIFIHENHWDSPKFFLLNFSLTPTPFRVDLI